MSIGKGNDQSEGAEIIISDGIEINGYQVSATAKGMRTIYSVKTEINGKTVEQVGLVYSLQV